MEDNLQVVTQDSSMTEYSTVIDAPSTYTMTDSEKGVENLDSSASLPSAQNFNPDDENAHAYGTSYGAVHVANGNVVSDSCAAAAATDNLVSQEVDAAVPTHTVNYDSMNGVPSEIVDYQSSEVVEYGASDPHAGAQHFEEVYSAEEERLWNAVRINCLDFNAWTALIEETEKVSEINILKIRKVYDAFLAEFPLCFGYWKKYADHEARLDGANKVLEVYERAILAVTYSVDIWLHYCLFAISTYEDPDIIRSHTNIFGRKVVKLYERCLIACANYPEYWIRYVLCMEASGSMELAINALARATQVFVKKQPDIHLFAARFKEHSGDILGARSEYELLYSEISPGFLEAILRHVNMEYRLGNKEDALSIYEKAIAAEQEKDQSQILPMLLILYSRFLYLVAGNAEKARDIFCGALETTQLSKPILEAAIHLESILPFPKRIEYLDLLVEKFITPNIDNYSVASTTDREDISCIFLEFLDLFGDPQSIKKADDRHALLFLRQKSILVSKKRRANDFLASEKAKIAKSSPLPAQSVMGAYPNSQNQWPVGYEQKVSSWPQGNPQTQGQPWNPGYPLQAGYSAYGYASYGQPQMPTSVAQVTTHGTYAPSYPSQAYTQQTYAAPTTAATASVAGFQQQQPAAATQPYYGATYY